MREWIKINHQRLMIGRITGYKVETDSNTKEKYLLIYYAALETQTVVVKIKTNYLVNAAMLDELFGIKERKVENGK